VYDRGRLRPPTAESCGGHHDISSRDDEVCLASPKTDRSMTMATLLLSPVESCGGDRGLLEKTGAFPSYS